MSELLWLVAGMFLGAAAAAGYLGARVDEYRHQTEESEAAAEHWYRVAQGRHLTAVPSSTSGRTCP